MSRWQRLVAAGGGAVLGGALLATAVPVSAAPLVTHPPRLAAAGGLGDLGWSSRNWSGYAVTAAPGHFTSVTGAWVVPAVSRTRKPTYSSSWVGIDGFNNSSLIQIGTEQDWYNGAAHYYAWYEILPAAETRIGSMSVQPGDVMTASITKDSYTWWTLSITDGRTKVTYPVTLTYSGPQSSAEWIEEAPSVGGRIATLADYGSTVFDPGTANAFAPNLTSSEGGEMVQSGKVVSIPSNPDGDKDGFAVAYGPSAPSPPGS